jgi:hypothetical protein
MHLIFFVFAVAIAYRVVAFTAALVVPGSRAFGLFATLTGISIVAIYIGNRLNVFDRLFRPGSRRLWVSQVAFVSVV